MPDYPKQTVIHRLALTGLSGPTKLSDFNRLSEGLVYVAHNAAKGSAVVNGIPPSSVLVYPAMARCSEEMIVSDWCHESMRVLLELSRPVQAAVVSGVEHFKMFLDDAAAQGDITTYTLCVSINLTCDLTCVWTFIDVVQE